jgi:hypothetical protein
MRDLKWIAGVLLICLLILAAITLLIPGVSAESTEVTQTPTPVKVNITPFNMTEQLNRTYEIHRISQGDVVYLGDHIDISGVVAGNKALAWFVGGEPDASDIPHVINLPVQKAGYYNFYIDPEVFSGMTGYWYKWNGYYESNGNTRAFYVVASYRNTTMTYPNGTVVNTSEILTGKYNATPKLPPDILPKKHVSDYLVTKGDSFNITVKEATHVWLFGRVDQLLDYRSVNDSIDFSSGFLSGCEAGSYTLIMQTVGNISSDFTVKYNSDDNTIMWFDPKLFMIHSESFDGYSPQVAREKFIELIPSFSDDFQTYKMEIEEPSLDIKSMDFVSTGSAKEYYRDSSLRGNVTLYDIRGYTNALPGTTLRFALDEKQQERVHWYNTTVMGEYLGDMRYFKIYVPIYWDDMKEGMHTISGYSETGGSIYRDFPIRIAPEHSFIPNQSVKWVDDRNPWVPTPPPEIITVIEKVPGPTVTVYVTVTPSETVVRAQQEKIIDEKIAFWVPRIITTVIGLIVLLYLASVHLRRKER